MKSRDEFKAWLARYQQTVASQSPSVPSSQAGPSRDNDINVMSLVYPDGRVTRVELSPSAG
ncbi:MAG: hypothetical protein AAGF01_12225 [Cyanobacteria bacterium P01_G01_bin.38]